MNSPFRELSVAEREWVMPDPGDPGSRSGPAALRDVPSFFTGTRFACDGLAPARSPDLAYPNPSTRQPSR